MVNIEVFRLFVGEREAIQTVFATLGHDYSVTPEGNVVIFLPIKGAVVMGMGPTFGLAAQLALVDKIEKENAPKKEYDC
jgi:hypothetical protein